MALASSCSKVKVDRSVGFPNAFACVSRDLLIHHPKGMSLNICRIKNKEEGGKYIE